MWWKEHLGNSELHYHAVPVFLTWCWRWRADSDSSQSQCGYKWCVEGTECGWFSAGERKNTSASVRKNKLKTDINESDQCSASSLMFSLVSCLLLLYVLCLHSLTKSCRYFTSSCVYLFLHYWFSCGMTQRSSLLVKQYHPAAGQKEAAQIYGLKSFTIH